MIIKKPEAIPKRVNEKEVVSVNSASLVFSDTKKTIYKKVVKTAVKQKIIVRWFCQKRTFNLRGQFNLIISGITLLKSQFCLFYIGFNTAQR